MPDDGRPSDPHFVVPLREYMEGEHAFGCGMCICEFDLHVSSKERLVIDDLESVRDNEQRRPIRKIQCSQASKSEQEEFRLRPAKWILVDWIGTTTNIRSTVVPELERFGKRCRVNADWDYVMDAWGVAQRVFLDQIVAGQAPWRPQAEILIDAFRATLTQAGINFDEIPKSALVDLGRFTANMKPWSDAQDGIAMLRQIRPVALYSLSPLDSLQMQTREAEIDFDQLLSAEPYRSYPPAPNGFSRAAAELGVSPEHVVFFSVHPPMLRGAENAGMQVVQIDRPMRDTRLTLFEPTADLHIQARPRDLQKAAEWLATHLPR